MLECDISIFFQKLVNVTNLLYIFWHVFFVVIPMVLLWFQIYGKIVGELKTLFCKSTIRYLCWLPLFKIYSFSYRLSTNFIYKLIHINTGIIRIWQKVLCLVVEILCVTLLQKIYRWPFWPSFSTTCDHNNIRHSAACTFQAATQTALWKQCLFLLFPTCI